MDRVVMMHNGRALYSLDRIDPNGHYEPGNVRWASQAEQCANKRLSRETVDRLLNEASGMSDPLSWLREQMLGGE